MPTLFDIFAADCSIILTQIGRDIVFRGNTVKAICAEPTPSDILAVGGFSGSASGQNFKVLRSAYAEQPPTEGELITFAGKKWVISTVDSRPLGPWFALTCKPWDA